MTDAKAFETRLRRLQLAVVFLLVSWMVTTGLLLAGRLGPGGLSSELRVRRLAIVDPQGVERVVISAPAPDPIVGGKRLKRNGQASGIIIYDRHGDERGGYLTADNETDGAFLTLDARDGQVFTAYANASDGATLSLNNQKGDGATMTTWNQPVLQLRQGKKIVVKMPPDAPDLH